MGTSLIWSIWDEIWYEIQFTLALSKDSGWVEAPCLRADGLAIFSTLQIFTWENFRSIQNKDYFITDSTQI